MNRVPDLALLLWKKGDPVLIEILTIEVWFPALIAAVLWNVNFQFPQGLQRSRVGPLSRKSVVWIAIAWTFFFAVLAALNWGQNARRGWPQ